MDVAVLTVIKPELQAVQRVLKIASRNRVHKDGAVYWETSRYSTIHDRDLKIVVHCIGSASQASASGATTRLLAHYDPALLILLGIAAGWRGKLKIGDVVVARDIADLSVNVVAENGERQVRPLVRPLRYPVTQVLQSFHLNKQAFATGFERQFGTPLAPPSGKEQEFRDNVAIVPSMHDCTIASADDLLRDSRAFERMSGFHPGIRAAEMEAGGFSRACEEQNPPRNWMVVRGISDFGDSFKDDQFQELACSAAAVYLDNFLDCGCDIDNLRPSPGPVSISTSASDGIPLQGSGEQKGLLLSQLSSEYVNKQFELFARALSEARNRDIESIREAWRASGRSDVLVRLQALKNGSDWNLLTRDTRAKALRLEASLLLALDQNVFAARTLADEARELDGLAGQALDALITYHEKGAVTALNKLDAPASLDAWNVKLALQLDSGNWRAVVDGYSQPPPGVTPDVESRRLFALGLLGAGKLTDARHEVQIALAEHPQWFSIRLTAAILDYFHSISPALFHCIPKHWPVPTDTKLVKRDKDTLHKLRGAESTLAELIKAGGLSNSARRELEGWRLACLANDAERQTEAQSYCATLLEEDPTHPVAILWASARDYVADLETSIAAITAELGTSQ